jgi:outer membrane lipoprotein-sorting protein
MRTSLVTSVLVLALTAPALADATADATKALIGFGRLSSYHMSMSTPTGQTLEIDVVNPNKMHFTTGSMQMIRIDDNSWVYVNGRWMAVPAMAAGQMSQMAGGAMAARTLSDHAQHVTVTDLGAKSVGGETLHAYGVKDPDTATTSTIYVGADGYVHQMDVVDGRGRTSTIHISQFNQKIAIDPPS